MKSILKKTTGKLKIVSNKVDDISRDSQNYSYGLEDLNLRLII